MISAKLPKLSKHPRGKIKEIVFDNHDRRGSIHLRTLLLHDGEYEALITAILRDFSSRRIQKGD